MTTAEPFTVAIPDESLARLRRKLEDTRLPDADTLPGADGWELGMDLAWLVDMRAQWLEFDWREVEREINSWPNFKAAIDGIDLHFIHARSERADAVPLVLIHGWPGSFYEFHALIEPLRAPADAAAPAFHVVIPSVPGFGFSSAPRARGWTVKETAALIDTLMTRVLGYRAYLAQGGDWGSLVATYLSQRASCALVHLNMCVVPPPHPVLYGLLWAAPDWASGWLAHRLLGAEDRRQLARSKAFALSAGYFAVHATIPLQIGLALNDSPIGLLAWVGSKYHAHVDPRAPFPTRAVLATLSLYFHTASFATSVMPYAENSFKEPLPRIRDAKLGVSVFDHDILVMPRAWVRSYHGRSLVFHRAHAEGGHFPALDNPDALVQDLRDFAGDHLDAFRANEGHVMS